MTGFGMAVNSRSGLRRAHPPHPGTPARFPSGPPRRQRSHGRANVATAAGVRRSCSNRQARSARHRPGRLTSIRQKPINLANL